MQTNNEAGHLAIQTLVLLSVMLLLGGGMAMMLGSLQHAAVQAQVRDQRDARLLQKIAELVDYLNQQDIATPDSRFSPVWQIAQTWKDDQTSTLYNEEISLEARDVSSRLNPNWARQSLLASPVLRHCYLPGANAAIIQQDRVDHGFGMNLKLRYATIFIPEAIDTLMSPWSVANPNSCDEFAFSDLYRERTGDDSAAEIFHERLRVVLASRTIVEPSGLDLLLAPHARITRGLINTNAIMNVNFIPHIVLEAVLSNPAWKVSNPRLLAARICSERDLREIDELGLKRLCGIDPARADAFAHGLLTFLGCQTRAWELRARMGKRELHVVVQESYVGSEPPQKRHWQTVLQEWRQLE